MSLKVYRCVTVNILVSGFSSSAVTGISPAINQSSSPTQLKPDFSLLVTFGAKKDRSSVVTDTLVKLGTTITN